MNDFDSAFDPTRLHEIVGNLLAGHFDVIHDRARIATGSDGIDLRLFLRDIDLHLSSIKKRVTGDHYRFSAFIEHEIRKEDSKSTRTISVASIRDVVVQRALYEYLYPIVDVRLSPSVVAYRKGCSTHAAVHIVRSFFAAGLTYVFDADLRKFFDTLNHDVLLEMVAGLHIDSRASKLIRRFLKSGRISSQQAEEYNSGQIRKYAPEPRLIGVPQGGVLSGLLSNLYLSQFDAAILQYHRGYVRYADDFLVCCMSMEECQHAQSLVEKELRPLCVELNYQKTRPCVSAEKGVGFVGFRLSTNKTRVLGKNIGKFKARIQSIINTQMVYNSAQETLKRLIRRLKWKIRGPSKEHLRKMALRGKPISFCRRSWIGFFRIVDDLSQIHKLDHWLRCKIARYMWKKHRVNVKCQEMRQHGLPSLVNSLYRSRLHPPTPRESSQEGME